MRTNLPLRKSVLTALAKSVLVPLGLATVAAAADTTMDWGWLHW